MTEFFVQKVQTERGPALYPCHESDHEAINEFPRTMPLRVNIRRIRNYEFHKKFFALLNFAFDTWEPKPADGQPAWAKNITPEKNFDTFRRDLIILAGYSDVSYRVNGDIRVEAKSISFAKMDEGEFSKLYDAVFNVILQYVLTNFSETELRDITEELESFG